MNAIFPFLPGKVACAGTESKSSKKAIVADNQVARRIRTRRASRFMSLPCGQRHIIGIRLHTRLREP